jgi:hypothetical protein
MSLLAIIVIVVAALAVIFFIGGVIVLRRRARENAGAFEARILAADQALETARAVDRGWDPALLEQAARDGLLRERPDFRYEKLHLVLVEDRPGTEQDRAEIMAVGDGGVVHVTVARRGDNWVAEGLS